MFSTVICSGKQRILQFVRQAPRQFAPGGDALGLHQALALLHQFARHAIERARQSCRSRRREETSTVASQSPAATRPALSARRCTGRVTRAVAHQLNTMPSRIPARRHDHARAQQRVLQLHQVAARTGDQQHAQGTVV